jgi:hypothetical protein
MRSECRCNIGSGFGFSCEPTLYPSKRFRFVTEDNYITDEIEVRGTVYKSEEVQGGIKDCAVRKEHQRIKKILGQY